MLPVAQYPADQSILEAVLDSQAETTPISANS